MTLLPAAQAAAPPDTYDAARTGIVDIADAHVGMSPGRFPLLELIDLPFIFKTPAARSTGLTIEALFDKYPEFEAEHPDVKVLFFHFTDSAHVWTTKKQIKNLDDMKGLLLLCVSKFGTESLKLLEASPQRSDPTSDYDMMAKGVVDGMAINAEAVMVTFHFIDVLNHCTQVGLGDAPFIDIMNMDTWNSLEPDLQELFVGDNGRRMTELMGYDFDNITVRVWDEVEKTFKERGDPPVYILPDEELAKWVELVKPVQEQWVQQAAAIVGEAKARAILEDAYKFAEQYRYETTPADELKPILHDWGRAGY
jgi:TRAP-type C4-dicarboxylate transport system substrate-binding protein